MFLSAYLLLSFVIFSTSGKIYDRCELAQELLDKHEAPKHQIATWVCIAQHESQFNTSAVGQQNGDGSKDHGIFQISDLFWCSPPGNGWACGLTCAELEDDDIEDDYICARRIYREHKKLSGDGFNAWVVYHTHCNGNVESYVNGCFNETVKTEETTSSPSTTTSTTTTAIQTAKESRSTIKTQPWLQWFSHFRWAPTLTRR